MTFLIKRWHCWSLELPWHLPPPQWSCMLDRWRVFVSFELGDMTGYYMNWENIYLQQGFKLKLETWNLKLSIFMLVVGFLCIDMIWNMKIWVITCKPHQPGFQYPCKRWQRRGCCQSCSNPRQGLCWKACVHWKYWYLCQDICTLHKTHVFEIYRSAKSVHVKMSIQWIFPIYISTCLPTELCLKVWCGYLQRAIIWLCYIIYAPVI